MRPRAVILDDSSAIRELLWRFFDKRGYEVFTFPDPGMCPLHVTTACPCSGDTSCSDLIISDVNMTKENGVDFLDQLLKKGCKQKNFALMSGGFTEADLTRAASLGYQVFEKPLDFDKITMWVEGIEWSIPTNRVLFDWATKT